MSLNTEITERYPWLQKAPDQPEDYLAPDYYNAILKDYTFAGKTDLEILDDHLVETLDVSRVLELGCGSGRSTEQILAHAKQLASLDIVDLSGFMVEFCRDRFIDHKIVTAHQSDSVDFLHVTTKNFDNVVSLWNLSHSVHQHMFKEGRQAAAQNIEHIIGRFIMNRLQQGGNMFIIQYDIQSPEQRLINPWRLRLWDEADPSYDATGQSPSKDVLDTTFSKLKEAGIIDFEVDHLEGDPIVYESVDEALEVFVNFHMEGYFNNSDEISAVISSLLRGFEPYTDSSGRVAIPPGAFKYLITKIKK